MDAAASVVSLADATFKIIAFINTIKEGGKQRMQLFAELNSLWMAIKMLEANIVSPEETQLSEAWKKTISILDENDGIFDQIQTACDELEERLKPKQGHRKIMQTLRWPFEKKDVDYWTDRLERLKSSVNLVLTSTSANVIREIQRDTEAIKLSVANDDVKSVIDWISSLNFWKQQACIGSGRLKNSFAYKNRQNDFIKQAREGTGSWFLEREDFRLWANGTESLLYAHGMPGAGKTYLASIAVEHLRTIYEKKNVAVLVIYCGYNEEKSQSVDNLIAALIKQILQVRPKISKELKAAHESHGRTGVFPPLNALMDIFHDEIKQFDSCFVIVDALDEMQEESKRLQLLHELVSRKKVNVMVTSRPLDSINDIFDTEIACDSCEEDNLRLIYHCQNCLDGGPILCEACGGKDLKCDEGHTISKKFRAYEIEIQATEGDIRNYLQWRIDHEPTLLKTVTTTKSLREEIAWTVVQQANGMFLLAKLHMDSLATKRKKGLVRDALQNLPTEIGATYDQAIERIEATNEDDRVIARTFMLWMAYTARLLTTREVEHACSIVAEAADIDPDDVLPVGDLTSMCAGLIIIDASDTVRFVHLSAQTYIRDNRERWFSDGEEVLTYDCLTYLSFKAFDEGAYNGSEELSQLTKRHEAYPLLEYSSSYWGVHAGQAEQTEDLTRRVTEFLANEKHLAMAVQVMWYSHSTDLADWDVKSGIQPLHLAAYYGLERVVFNLLREGAVVDCRDTLQTTPLMYASLGGHTATVRTLLRQGSNPNLECRRSNNALHRAVFNDRDEVARLLLAQPDIDLNAIDTVHQDKTPLMLAVSRANLDLLPVILNTQGLDVNFASGKWQTTALTLAADLGVLEIVRAILSHPQILVNKKDSARSALTYAAENGDLAVVEALLDHGADTELQEGADHASGTPLNRAIDEGKTDVVRLLLDRGANPKVLDIYNRTIVHSAGVNGQDDVLRILFEKPRGVDINAQGTNGRTALHDAAYFDYQSTIQILFDNGARTDIHDNAHRSPLGVAKDNNNLEALDLLSRLRRQEQHQDESTGRLRHADTSIKSNEMGFLTAVQLGMKDAVHSFIARSKVDDETDLNLVDLDRHSGLHIAVREDHVEILEMLIEAGVDVNTQDRLERTPLHWCQLYYNYPAAESLLEANARVDLKDHFGDTCLDMSLGKSRWEMTVLLLEHGAQPTPNRLQQAFFAVGAYGDHTLVRKLVKAGANPLQKDYYGRSPYHLAEEYGNPETAKTILAVIAEREQSGEDVADELVTAIRETDVDADSEIESDRVQ